MLNRARILLKADTGEHATEEGPALADREIARMLEIGDLERHRGACARALLSPGA
jgi:hypothetical protein